MITIDDVQAAYNEWKSISTTPDSSKFKRYLPNHIFDEDQSVRWNNEEVVRRNAAYRAERDRLIALASDCCDKFRNITCNYIKEQLNFNDAQTKILFEYASGDYCYIPDGETIVDLIEELVWLQRDISQAGVPHDN